MNDEPAQDPAGPSDGAKPGLVEQYWRSCTAWLKAYKRVFFSIGAALFISAGLIFLTPFLLPQSLRSLDRLDGPHLVISDDQEQRARLDNPQHYFNLAATIQRPNALDCGGDWTAYLLSLGGLLGFNASAVSEIILEVEISGAQSEIRTLPLIQLRRTGDDLDACSVVGFRDEITLFEDWMRASPDTKVSISLLRRSGRRFSALNIMRQFGDEDAPQYARSLALTSQERERLSQNEDRFELRPFSPNGEAAPDELVFCLGDPLQSGPSDPATVTTCNTPITIGLRTQYLRSHLRLTPENRPWATYGPPEEGGIKIDLQSAYQNVIDQLQTSEQSDLYRALKHHTYLSNASPPVPAGFYADLRGWIYQTDGRSELDFNRSEQFDRAAVELQDWFRRNLGFHHDDVVVATYATLEGDHHRLDLGKLSQLSSSSWLGALVDEHDLETMVGRPCGDLLSRRSAPCPTRSLRSRWHDVCQQNASAGQHNAVRVSLSQTQGAVDGILDRIGPTLQTLRQSEKMSLTCQVAPDFTIEILDDRIFPAATRHTLSTMIEDFESGSVLSGEPVRDFLSHLTPDRARCGYTRSDTIETHGDVSELYFLMELPSVLTSLQSALSRGDPVHGYLLGVRNAPSRYYVPVHAEFLPGAKGDLQSGWVLQTLRFGAPEDFSGEPDGWPLAMDHRHCQALSSAL